MCLTDDSDHGWRGRQKQNETQIRNRILANELNEAAMSSTIVSSSPQQQPQQQQQQQPQGHTVSNVECQKSTHKESSPPNIFNNSSSLKYLHKKFKRVASAVIEDNCEKVKTNSNANILAGSSPLLVHSSLVLHSGVANGEISARAVQSHINESETNSQEFVARCVQCRKSLDDRQHKFCNECNLELISKYNHVGLKTHVTCSGNFAIAAATVAVATAAAAATDLRTDGMRISTVQPTFKPYEMDFVNNISKHETDRLIRIKTVSPLQQKTNKRYEYDAVVQEIPDIRAKSGVAAHNFKENFIKVPQIADLSVQSVSTSSKIDDGGAGNSGSSASAANKSSVRRKNCDRPYPCVTCGLEFKSRSLANKHCR